MTKSSGSSSFRGEVVSGKLRAGVSRRALLSGMSGIMATAFAPRLALGAETTSKSALEGELLEDVGADYKLVAQFANYPLELEYGVGKDGKLDQGSPDVATGQFEYLCRSWGLDGVFDGNFLGPVLELKPGQNFSIKIVNNLREEGIFKDIGPAEPKPEDWLPLIDPKNGEYAFLHNVDPLGMPFANDCNASSSMADITVDEVNIPRNYNWTNLHLHGLQITPHLFEPEGTLDKASDYITIKPGEEKTYSFTLAEDHPCGTFWYHPHRHNSVAIQAWSGMAGLVLVRGKYDEELKSYGISTEIPFAVHDPHYSVTKAPEKGSPGIAKVARFLASQNGEDDYSFLVTGRYRPEYEVKRNEVVLIRHLSATIENVNGFRIVKSAGAEKPVPPDTDDGNIPFHIIASDGIAYDKPVQRMSMVCGGGERHDLLVQFPEPGVYEVWSDHCGTIQFYGGGPKDQLLATFRVTDEVAEGQAPISEMTFTPGIPPEQDIRQEEIVRRRHFVFDLAGDTCKFPYPQFRIDDRDYRPDDTYFDVKAGTVEEWVVSSPSAATHPIHIHVNPFQVKEVFGALSVNEKLVPEHQRQIVTNRIEAMRHLDRPNMWRDTIVIPQKGMVRLWMRFDPKLLGKTVFHCHFLAHEETGMLQNFRIVP